MKEKIHARDVKVGDVIKFSRTGSKPLEVLSISEDLRIDMKYSWIVLHHKEGKNRCNKYLTLFRLSGDSRPTEYMKYPDVSKFLTGNELRLKIFSYKRSLAKFRHGSHICDCMNIIAYGTWCPTCRFYSSAQYRESKYKHQTKEGQLAWRLKMLKGQKKYWDEVRASQDSLS